ncbi:hypothetical protein Cch01nite_39290 [Cellulomonas chitinilytica]|uniref:Uncharacterized protein n=1 Tax=Cellulomonas chitinilytica TaxID=398759 RepID=A0A919P6K6_9CELL|nr:hypothetical protein Cch01nite_39290 [Cellulomonas chitinilytica]
MARLGRLFVRRRPADHPGPGRCPGCDHRWDEHAGSGNDDDGVCGECAYEVEHGQYTSDAAPCRRVWIRAARDS